MSIDAKSPPLLPLPIREINFESSSLKELERLVLLNLTKLGHRFGDDFYFTYSAISKVAPDVPIAYLKTAMKVLRDKGFAQYMNGLSCDDGYMRGSGHKITKTGAAYLLAHMRGKR